MKFKRILAVVLSALMLTSMASFTVSAKEDAELMAEPLLELLVSSDDAKAAGLLKQCERGTATSAYDAENDIVYNHYVPNFAGTNGDNSLYFNMYGLDPAIVPSTRTLYVVTYMRSNVAATTTAGFYQVKNSEGGGAAQPTSEGVAYAGDEKWTKMVYTLNLGDDFYSSNHLWIRPIGNNKVINDDGSHAMADDAYFDICGVALFDDLASAEAYDLAALNKAPTITISFDAGAGTGEYESYTTVPGYINPSNVVFPTTAPVAPEGMEFNGWAAEETGTPLTGDVATPDISTKYYAQYKYVDNEEVEYDDIYLQNVYYKLMNDKNLTIGYLGGSVTVGSGAENPGANSKVAWRALTTQWFKDNFADATIKEVYAGIGGTGSTFGSYRMTRDLDLANNKIDLLFVDSCVNDSYEGFSYADKDYLWENDAVIVAKILENNPKCEIVFINVTDNGKIKSAADAGAVQAHREFAQPNGFAFVDFKIAMARELTGDPEATHAEDISKWNDYYADSVHPKAAGYKVYFEYLRDELLADLVNEELNVSKAKYEDTVPTVLDLDTVDTDRYIGGNANSNAAEGLATIKNYLNGQDNGFMGGNSMSAAAEGYSFTFKFTGKNALIWSNKHVENALLDVYVNDNTNIGSPDNTIDMWRNQKAANDAQNYLFPVLAEDLDEAAETTVTIVLRKNVDTATRTEQLGYNAEDVGDALRNQIRNIAIKGGTMDSVEFLNAPDAFKTEVKYEDIVVPNTFFNKGIDSAVGLSRTPGTQYPWIDGETMIDTLKLTRDGDKEGNFATDGWGLQTYGIVLDHYNYVTYYLYVDDPEGKTADKKIFCNVYQLSGGGTSIESEYTIVPNAWQRIPISLANCQAKAQPLEALKQFHFRPLGNGTTVQAMDGVTVYLEKAVFSAENPGYWADLDAKVTNIKVDGESVEGFNINTFEYNVVLPYGTTEVPTVTADKNIPEAVITIVQADSVTGKATVTLEGATDADDVVYTINFSVFDGIKVNGFKAGDVEIAIEEGKTEYVVNLPAGTTEVPEIVADFEGDPAKITTTQATALDGAATIELDDGTVYTITFNVLPSLEEIYEGAKIVYVSEAGAGEKNGTSMDNAYATLKAALNAEAATEGKVVFAILDDVKITSNADLNIPKDFVITSVGGDIYATSHPTFKTNGGSDIVIENIDIYHTRATGGINGEIYLVAKGNNLTLKNVNAIPYSEREGEVRTATLFVQPGGDGGNFTKTEDTKLVIENVTGITVRGGGYGGSTFAGGIDYTIGGETVIGTINTGIQAAGSSNQKTGDAAFDANGNPVTNQPEANRTVNGDIAVAVKDEAKVTTITATNYGILKGDLVITVQDDATVGTVDFSASSIKKKNQAGDADVLMAEGRLEGNGIVYILGGSVGTVKGTQGQKRAIVVDLNNAVVPEYIANVNNIVTYEGNGTVTIEYAEDGTASIALASETAKFAEVTFADGSVKKYDMSTDEEVVLAHDMAIAITEGTTAVVFNEGVGVTFKALEADGAKADYTETFTGLEGMKVEKPADPEVKNDYFEFVGWALEGTTDIVTDFGTFTAQTPAAVTYVAIFKEAPAVQFKAYAADGASADYEKTIYGITGNPVSDKMAAEGVEAPAAIANHTFLGWALEGTTIVVDEFGTFADEKAVYVAIYDEDPYAVFKATVEAGAAEAIDTKIYGVLGQDIVAPTVTTKEHFTFKGWALEGTTDIVENLIFDQVDNTYVAIIEEDPKFTVTVYDGNDKVDEVTDYKGFTYTFKKLENTPTSRFLGYSLNEGATEADLLAGDEITVISDNTFYAVRKEIKLEDAQYTFAGSYDYSEQKYIIEMYYEGPEANMTAYGFEVDEEVFGDIEYVIAEALQSTGTNADVQTNYVKDVVYPASGATFGDDMKTPVLVATITASMTPEQYAALVPADDFVELGAAEDITGAYANNQWQYIKNDPEFSLDIASRVYPIYFTELVDDKDITVTVEGVVAEISTVTAPTEGKKLEAITFTVETAEGEEPGLVAYYVDGVAMGELVAGDDGITYTIPAEKVLGDVTIELSYGEPILEVTITDIEAPVAQATPDTEATAGHDTYTIDSVTWEPADAEFGFDTAYTVKVTVTAADEYAFTGKTVYTINGETATVKKVDIDTVELSYTFAPTVKELGKISVAAGLVRKDGNKAYANFATITVLAADGAEVAAWTETAEDAAVAAEFEVLAGTYTVKIAKNGYLTYTEEVEVVYNETTEVEKDLVAGNLYGEGIGADNNEIDLLDFAALTSAFTKKDDTRDADTLAAYRARVDIDEDGVVNVFDLNYIKGNFGEKAE